MTGDGMAGPDPERCMPPRRPKGTLIRGLIGLSGDLNLRPVPRPEPRRPRIRGALPTGRTQNASTPAGGPMRSISDLVLYASQLDRMRSKACNWDGNTTTGTKSEFSDAYSVCSPFVLVNEKIASTEYK